MTLIESHQKAKAALLAQLGRLGQIAETTGMRTLASEIARRLRPEDPARLTDVQRAILRAAATQARPGGRVIYATCSVLREACEEVLEGVGELLEPVPFDAPRVAEVFPPDRSSLRLLPGTHGTDGYFVASLRRR